MKYATAWILSGLLASAGLGKEHHVSVQGSDNNDGSLARPYRTISAAARIAQPGDVITVHEGTCRERVTPPRGGESDSRLIVYQAAPGETAVIKGSEVIRGWKQFAPGVWKVTVPNSLFGPYNPYKDVIVGDWFDGKGRPHHTGDVYRNGVSLNESNLLERVLAPDAAAPNPWFAKVDDQNTYIYAVVNRYRPPPSIFRSCSTLSIPGTSVITNNTGRMKMTIGKSILMPAFPTAASARSLRRVRKASA